MNIFDKNPCRFYIFVYYTFRNNFRVRFCYAEKHRHNGDFFLYEYWTVNTMLPWYRHRQLFFFIAYSSMSRYPGLSRSWNFHEKISRLPRRRGNRMVIGSRYHSHHASLPYSTIWIGQCDRAQFYDTTHIIHYDTSRQSTVMTFSDYTNSWLAVTSLDTKTNYFV